MKLGLNEQAWQFPERPPDYGLASLVLHRLVNQWEALVRFYALDGLHFDILGLLIWRKLSDEGAQIGGDLGRGNWARELHAV